QMKLTNFLPILCLLTASLGAFAQSAPSPLRPSKKAISWADKTLKKMSVDEKIGQLIHVGVNARYLHQQSASYRELHRHVTENHIGGIIFFVGPVYETVHLANRMQAVAKTPLLISLDAETGVGMRFLDAEVFPWAMAVAATGEPELARRMGEIAGIEARALGFQHVFAPVVDVNYNAANPVINVRSFGEDPEDVSRFANAFIRG